ncbi:MAG: hypothetical protein HY226_02215 [Candidatus Vogelbacteria bacterium]|nr:hypothetical protein [Candidatus Vogelbacteria bacterium]
MSNNRCLRVSCFGKILSRIQMRGRAEVIRTQITRVGSVTQDPPTTRYFIEGKKGRFLDIQGNIFIERK